MDTLYAVEYTNQHGVKDSLTYTTRSEAEHICRIINNMYALDELHRISKASIREIHPIIRHIDLEHALFIPNRVEFIADYSPKKFSNGSNWYYWIGRAEYRDEPINTGYYGKDRIELQMSSIDESVNPTIQFIMYIPVKPEDTLEIIFDIGKRIIVDLYAKSKLSKVYKTYDDILNSSARELISHGFKWGLHSVALGDYYRLVYKLDECNLEVNR